MERRRSGVRGIALPWILAFVHPSSTMLLVLVIRNSFRSRLTWVGASLLLFVPFGYAAPPTIQIHRVEHAPRLADFEAMPCARGVSEIMWKVSGFIAGEPAGRAPPTQDTDVYLPYDDHTRYAV